jgi:murein DD-endopeptidase MepM/ murein hydrolase activator NlpD
VRATRPEVAGDLGASLEGRRLRPAARADRLWSGEESTIGFRQNARAPPLADGTVVIAGDLFFTGKAVFVDHGNALVSVYFHLSEIKVQAGQDVKKGEASGGTTPGSTRRSCSTTRPESRPSPI